MAEIVPDSETEILSAVLCSAFHSLAKKRNSIKSPQMQHYIAYFHNEMLIHTEDEMNSEKCYCFTQRKPIRSSCRTSIFCKVLNS